MKEFRCPWCKQRLRVPSNAVGVVARCGNCKKEIRLDHGCELLDEKHHAQTDLIHDTAHACAVSIIELLRNLFREEELRDGMLEVRERVKAAIEWYELHRKEQRFIPSEN